MLRVLALLVLELMLELFSLEALKPLVLVAQTFVEELSSQKSEQQRK